MATATATTAKGAIEAIKAFFGDGGPAVTAKELMACKKAKATTAAPEEPEAGPGSETLSAFDEIALAISDGSLTYG